MSWSDLFLGLVQGVTEFLPVSSSGHLFLMEKILNHRETSLSFVLLLHTATLLAVLTVFFRDIKSFVFGIGKKKNLQLFFKLCLALVPLFFVGLFLRSFVQQSFEKNTVAFGFLSTGLLLFSLFFIKRKNQSLEKMSFLQAFLIGLSQALAVFPGFSRSAWTIATGLYCGLSPRSAVYFSFLISLPAIAGSAVFDLAGQLSKNPELFNAAFTSSTTISLSLPFVAAFTSGLLSLLLVLKMVQSQKLFLFAFYLLPLSFLVFLFL